MPRNGSDIYSIPPGTEGFPDTTIESAKYNTYVHDVETDLNTPRPIVAGGTGANDADEALINLSAEKSSAEVTNYDSHVWIPGSFYSASTATGAPISGRPFVGLVVSSDLLQDPPLNQNVVVHARDQNDNIVPGRLYVREKKAGTWGPWKPDGVSLYTSDTPPTGAPDNSLWWETDTGLLYVRYNDEAGAPQWVIACPQPDISTFAMKAEIPGIVDESAVRYDAPQTLTTPQLVQARSNIYAAPYDAMAYSGMQINGGCEISQELGASGRTTAGYFADGWIVGKTGTMVISAQTPVTPIIPGFNAFVGVYITTAQVSLGATDNLTIVQYIEGYRIARLAWGTASAAPITIAFWSRHVRTGLYTVAVRNAADNRSYCAGYTHAVSDVAQYNVVTVPGCTDGTWDATNITSMKVAFCQAAGSTYTAPAGNVWNSFGYLAVPGQVNAAGATSDVMRIAGVTVLPGSQAPTAAQSPFVMRSFDQELLTCKRYWCRFDARLQVYAAASNPFIMSVSYPVEMRATPSAVLSATTYTNASGIGMTTPADNKVITIYATATATALAMWQTTVTANAQL